VVLSAPIAVPSPCVDGVKRNLYEYVAYLLGDSLDQQVATLQSQVGGVTFGWRVPTAEVQVVVSQAQ
jgi:hypothetical protein